MSKIHQTVVDEILDNRPFHDACEAAFKEAGYEIELPFRKTQAAVSTKIAKPVDDWYKVPADMIVLAGDEFLSGGCYDWEPCRTFVGQTYMTHSILNVRRRIVDGCIQFHGVILEGDEFKVPTGSNVWQKVGDSVGHHTNEYSKSIFRRRVV